MKNKLWLICIAISFSTLAQDKLNYLKDSILFKQIDSLDSLEKYQEIIDVLDLVNQNDSIIHLANIKKTYYYLKLKEYHKTIDVCNKALLNAKNDGDINSFYVNKAIAYSRLNKTEDALDVYNEAIKLFPKNSGFYRRRGTLYQEEGMLEKAYQDLKQAIIINPFDVDNHLILGDLFFVENKLSQALMVYNMYLLISPDGNSSFRVLNFLNNKFASKTSNKPKGITYTKDDEKFEEIDVFIDNRVALNNDYKFKNKIEIAYVKQNHLLFSLLSDIEFEDDFFNKYYASVYHWMIDNNRFDDFIYTTCYSIENKKYKKVIQKNEKKVIEFYPLFNEEYANNIKKVEESFNGKVQEVYHSYEKSKLTGIGLKKEGKYNGLWKFYNKYGKISAEGSFNNKEQRIGLWKWYHNDGTISEELNYVDGKAEGSYKVYYSNGNTKVEAAYKQDVLDGNYKNYTRNGALSEHKNFVNGELDGSYKSFYAVGKDALKYKTSYKQGKLNGKLEQFYDNGNLYYQTNFVDDLKEGEANYYFRNNQLFKKYKLINDNIEGEYIEYFNNGNVNQKGNYIQDELDGIWNVYYSNGNKYQTIGYKSDDYDGLYKEYSQLGHLYQQYDYKKGKLYKATFFDSNNNVLYNEKKEHNELEFKGYGTLGNIRSEGLYNVKGGSKGPWKFYDRNGYLTSEEFYIEDKLEGEVIVYYKDGVVKRKNNYKNGLLDGYSVNYYHNGQISSQGYFLEGNQDKSYVSYYIDGTIKNKLYFHKDELNGKQLYHKVDGSLDYTETYEYGALIKQTIYGETEKNILHVLDYQKLGINSPIQVTKYYQNGNLYSKITYVNGVAHGEASFYYTNGKLKTQGFYNNGSKQNTWKSFYKDGTLEREAVYDGGDLNGERKRYYENGNLYSSETYLLGNEVGKYMSYAKDGKSKSHTIDYTNNLKNGESVFYDGKGNIQLIRYYNMGVLIGYSYPDSQGEILKMIPIKNETAKIVAYYKNGKKSREFEIIGGIFENEYKTYYYNGQLKKEHFYVNNEQKGIHKEYFETGKIKVISNYLEGYMHGKHQKFYANGKLKEEFLYRNNEKDGPYKKYDQNGNVLEQGMYSNGVEFKQK